MYKSRFRKWGWQKYRTERARTSGTRRDVPPGLPPLSANARRRGITQDHDQNTRQPPELLPDIHLLTPFTSLQHFNSTDRGFSEALSCTNQLFRGAFEDSNSWTLSSRVSSVRNSSLSRYCILRGLACLETNRVTKGFRHLHKGFSLIGKELPGETGSPIAQFTNLFCVPLDLAKHSDPNILIMFIRYKADLCRLELTSGHPATRILHAMAALVQSESPAVLTEFLVVLCMMWAEKFKGICGAINCQVLRMFYDILGLGAKISSALMREMMFAYEHLLQKVEQEHGEDRISALMVEHELLNFQDQSSLYSDDFVFRSKAVLDRLPPLELTRGNPNNPTMAIYKVCNWRLSRYFRRNGELRRAAVYRWECCRFLQDEWDLAQRLILIRLLRETGDLEASHFVRERLQDAYLRLPHFSMRQETPSDSEALKRQSGCQGATEQVFDDLVLKLSSVKVKVANNCLG